MTAPAHIITGVAILYAVPDPILAIPLAVFSHVLLDNACVYHPDGLLKVDSKGKKILLGAGILALLSLIFLIKGNFNAYLFGIVFGWLSIDIQWLIRFMWGKDILHIHQWFSRCYRSTRWQFILIEFIIMLYGLYVIWRNLKF